MGRLAKLTMVFFALVLSGCGVGYNQTLFVTSANVGLNVDTRPPTAELSIGRREGVIAATFEGGRHPPVYASFGQHAAGFLPLTTETSGLFAGGHAATLVSISGAGSMADDLICLTKAPVDPDGNSPFDAGQVKPMFFGTDTTLGLKVAWNGTAGPYPDSVKMGYNRTEFALAPVFLAADTAGCPLGTIATAHIPSFLASINTKLTAAGLAGGIPATSSTAAVGNPSAGGGSSFDYTQFFATGVSAENLAMKDNVRTAYQLTVLDANTVSDNSKKLGCWLAAPGSDETTRKGRQSKLDTFLKTNDVTEIDFFYDKKNAPLQQLAVDTLGVSCP
jgi:hypothetical protein